MIYVIEKNRARYKNRYLFVIRVSTRCYLIFIRVYCDEQIFHCKMSQNDILPISSRMRFKRKHTYKLIIYRCELRRIARVRIRRSSLASARGCKVPDRIRVTQTSAGFSDAGGLPACKRMNRRRTGVYPLIVNMQECLCVHIHLRTRRREGGFCFLMYMSTKNIWRVSRSAMPRLRNRKYISSFYLISNSLRSWQERRERKNIYTYMYYIQINRIIGKVENTRSLFILNWRINRITQEQCIRCDTQLVKDE